MCWRALASFFSLDYVQFYPYCRPVEDEFDAHIPTKVHRVPTFEQFYTPVLNVS